MHYKSGAASLLDNMQEESAAFLHFLFIFFLAKGDLAWTGLLMLRVCILWVE